MPAGCWGSGERGTQRYTPILRSDEDALTRAIIALATKYGRYGYRRITVQTYYRWRKEFGGLKLDQAKRLKELEKENSRLKRLVAELSLEKQVLREVAQGNF